MAFQTADCMVLHFVRLSKKRRQSAQVQLVVVPLGYIKWRYFLQLHTTPLAYRDTLGKSDTVDVFRRFAGLSK